QNRRRAGGAESFAGNAAAKLAPKCSSAGTGTSVASSGSPLHQQRGKPDMKLATMALAGAIVLSSTMAMAQAGGAGGGAAGSAGAGSGASSSGGATGSSTGGVPTGSPPGTTGMSHGATRNASPNIPTNPSGNDLLPKSTTGSTLGPTGSGSTGH